MVDVQGSLVPSRKTTLFRRAKCALVEVVLLPYIVTFLWVTAVGCLCLRGLVSASWPVALVSIAGYCAIISYLLLRDWLFGSRGLFREVFGLRLVNEGGGEQITVAQSCLRNCLWAAPAVLALLPLLFYVPVLYSLDTWGLWAYAAALVLEGAIVILRKDMRRVGDLIAGTRVVETDAYAAPNKRLRRRKVIAYLVVITGLALAVLHMALYVAVLLHERGT